MADKSKIEWTDATWNPIRARNLKTGKVGWHCEHATTGCEFCYAEGFNKRLGTGLAFKPGHRKDIEIFLDEEMLLQPLRWKRPRMIFPGSMTDLFADFVTDKMLDNIFAVMALTPQHTYQPLTKRAARMRAYLSGEEVYYRIHSARAALYEGPDREPFSWPLPNVWLGVSTERQQEADERIPELLATPAAVRFISAEPLLGRINLAQAGLEIRMGDLDEPVTVNLDQVIVGGESGPKARPMHPDWARFLESQGNGAGVKFFFKQWGQWAPVCALDDAAIDKLYRPAPVRDPDASRRCLVPQMILHADGTQFTDVAEPMAFAAGAGAMTMFSVGKGRAGRQLDGVEHNGMPVTVKVGAAA